MSNNNQRNSSAELCTPSLSLISVSLCVFPDSTLTPENLSTVLDIMRDWVWNWFSRYVNIPESEINKIIRQYGSERERKQAMIHSSISVLDTSSPCPLSHPTLSSLPSLSDAVAVVSCHNSLDLLQQKFPTGNTYCIQQQYGLTPESHSPAQCVGVGTYGLLNITNVFPLPA